MKRKPYQLNKKTIKRKSNRKVKAGAKKIKSITKDMSFSEILEKYPKAAETFMKSGMHCFGCSMAAYESLEQGAIMHGLNPDKLVAELNKKFERKNK